MPQLQPKAAKQLNLLESKLAVSAERLKDEQGRYDALFRQVWQVFDQEMGEGAPARFVCEDGFVLGRLVPRVTPTVDAAKLLKLITRHLPGLKGKRLASRITILEPRIDQARLAQEILKGRIDQALVQQCVVAKDPVPRRERHKASAHTIQALEAGILDSPAWEEEAG